MKRFKWDDSYSVGNAEIDSHHKKLINLFNEVGELIEKDGNTPLFSSIKIISELNVYAVFHFKEEEKLMEEANYPELASHIEKHIEFISQVRKFKNDYLNNDPMINFEMFDYLSKWILEHIVREDKKYMDYIN